MQKEVIEMNLNIRATVTLPVLNEILILISSDHHDHVSISEDREPNAEKNDQNEPSDNNQHEYQNTKRKAKSRFPPKKNQSTRKEGNQGKQDHVTNNKILSGNIDRTKIKRIGKSRKKEGNGEEFFIKDDTKFQKADSDRITSCQVNFNDYDTKQFAQYLLKNSHRENSYPTKEKFIKECL